MVFIVDTRAEMHDTEWLQCSLFLRNPDLPFLSKRSEAFDEGKKARGPRCRHDKGGPVPADDEGTASEQRVSPSTEKRPNDADDNVTNTAFPRISAGEDTGAPTRQRSEDDPRNPAQV